MRSRLEQDRRAGSQSALPKYMERRKDSGAQQSRIKFTDRLRSYIANHRLMAMVSLRRLLQTPIPSLMTWMVIAIALALPAGLFVFLQNAQQLSAGWDRAVQISVYVRMDISEEDGRALAQRLHRRPDVQSAEYISRDAALAEFRELSGFGEALEYLDDNPLPAVIIVQPDTVTPDIVVARKLLEELRQIAEIEQAQLDLEWVQRLYSLMELGQRAVLMLGLLLSLAVLLVIGNTIRLSIESRREEIVVIKLVGGTNAFVRRPFLYSGIWYGLGGGIMAWVLISLVLVLLSGPVDRLVQAYRGDFDLSGLGFTYTALLLLVSGLLGVIGAWLAVGRHLAAIEPR